MNILLITIIAIPPKPWREMLLLLSKQKDFNLGLVYQEGSENDEELQNSGVDINHLHIHSKFDRSAGKKLKQIILKKQYDIIYATTSQSLAIALRVTKNMTPRPICVGYRGALGLLSKFDPGNWISYHNSRLRGVICVSKAIQEDLKKSRCKAKLKTIPLGLDSSWYQQPGRKVLKEFSITDEDFVVACIATIRPVKGIDLLLSAIIKLDKIPNLKLLLIGPIEDPVVEKMLQLPELKDRVVACGKRNDAQQLISGADVYVQPSRREGLCKAVMEAMFQKVAPVITRVGGMVELVKEEETGLIVPSENPEALADAISRLYYDPDLRLRFAEESHKRILEHYTVEGLTKMTVEFFSQLLKEDRK